MPGIDRPAVVLLLLGGALSAIVGIAAAEPAWLWVLAVGLTLAATVVRYWGDPAAGEGRPSARRPIRVLSGVLVAATVLALVVSWSRSRDYEEGLPTEEEPPPVAAEPPSGPQQSPKTNSSATRPATPPPSQGRSPDQGNPEPPARSADHASARQTRPMPHAETAPLTVVALKDGQPVAFGRTGVTLAAAYTTDRLGTIATLQISAVGESPIVEAVLGPGGQIPFRACDGEHTLTVVAWSPENGTLDITVDPAIK